MQPECAGVLRELFGSPKSPDIAQKQVRFAVHRFKGRGILQGAANQHPAANQEKKLEYHHDHQCSAGEGKTLTSINLAAAFAKEFDQTVLLVDCDLRRQNIHKYLNYRYNKGIADYLINGCPFKDLIVWPNIEKLTVISGGRTIANSAELLSSPKMKSLVQEIKHRYDNRYVIFDLPPILSNADAIAFAPLVDCILMVVEEGRTSIKDVKKSLEMIPNEKFMGYVLNRRKAPIRGYYY